MKVPFLDLRAQYVELQDEIDRAAIRTLDSGWYILGKECELFESAFKQYLVGSEPGYVIGVNSGTDALKLSLLAAGVGPGDEVITPANTAIPTAVAISSIGAVPVFCDVRPETWLMNEQQLAALVTKKTKAVIPVHLYGASCDMDAIMTITRGYGLTIIEDVAQATGSMYRGKMCGTIGDFGAFSFYPSKNLGACGDGGAIFVKTAKKRETLVMLRNYGQSSRYKADLAGGENSRLDEIQAAILSVKLRHLDRWNSLRQERASYYLRKLQEIGLPVRVLQENEGAKAAYHLFVIKTEATLRDKLMTSLHESGIQTLVHYPYPLPHQLAFARFNRDAVPVCEDLCSSIISLPFHQYLTFKEIDMIIASIGDFFRKI